MRRLVGFAVGRAQLTIVVFLMLVAVGVESLRGIPKSEDPTFPVAIFTVVAVYPGATPTDVERLVVEPIETALKSLDDVKRLRTRIDDGLGVVTVEFTAGSDADKKYDDVQRELNALRGELPADLRSLEVKRFNAANVNIAQVALVSENAAYAELERLSDRLRKRLETVPGVKDVERWGFPRQEVGVELDLERLASLGLPPARVLGAIAQTNVNLPGGAAVAGARRFNVKTSGDYQSLDEIRDTPVGAAAGRILYLRDVASVELRDEELTTYARHDGQRAVFVTASMKERHNIFSVREALEPQLAAFARELPPGVRLARGFDQARNVEHRLAGFTRDFALAIGLVLLTLLPLGLRAAGIVMVSIPLSLAIGVAILAALGYSINQLSIVGFVIALGLLVDDSIVVVENITRVLREGRSRREAAIAATTQIAVSVLGCTATLILAFVPLLFLPGTPGLFIRSLPVAVIATIGASLVVSLTIVPFLASRLLPRAAHAEGNWFLRTLHRAIEASYGPVLARALRRPWLTLGAAGLLVAATVALLPRIGFSLFPKAGTPQFLVQITTPDGASLDETDRAVRFAEQAVARLPGVEFVMASIGQGNPQIYYNVAQQNARPTVGELFVQLDRADPARLERLRDELSGYPGARLEVKEFENGPPLDAPIAVRLVGEKLDTLKSLAAEVQALVAAQPGTLYVRNPLETTRTDLRVAIDRQRAALLGVPLVEIDRTVRLALAGVPAGSYREPDSDLEARAITVTLPRRGRASLADLDRLTVASASGAQVPLRQVAELALEAGPATIDHEMKQRSVTITAHTRPGYNTAAVTAEIIDRLDGLSLPAGYRVEPAGEHESQKESFGGLGLAIIVASFGVLAVLVLEFKTFKGTLIVASVIPLGIVGGILALYLTGNTLSFTATIGFIALIGIEVKNSILLVDFTNQLREGGMALDAAIARAGEARFVPILLTTLTALGGLVPLALEGSPLYSPLAWVIVGGLITSTVLARVVTPVLYKLLAPQIESGKDAREELHGFARATGA